MLPTLRLSKSLNSAFRSAVVSWDLIYRVSKSPFKLLYTMVLRGEPNINTFKALKTGFLLRKFIKLQ